jgi:hypothetical protein
MPLIIAATAAYASYRATHSSDVEMDAEIDLEGTTEVRFLPMEAPISTTTFFNGRYNLVAPYLQKKVEAIRRQGSQALLR